MPSQHVSARGDDGRGDDGRGDDGRGDDGHGGGYDPYDLRPHLGQPSTYG